MRMVFSSPSRWYSVASICLRVAAQLVTAVADVAERPPEHYIEARTPPRRPDPPIPATAPPGGGGAVRLCSCRQQWWRAARAAGCVGAGHSHFLAFKAQQGSPGGDGCVALAQLLYVPDW